MFFIFVFSLYRSVSEKFQISPTGALKFSTAAKILPALSPSDAIITISGHFSSHSFSRAADEKSSFKNPTGFIPLTEKTGELLTVSAIGAFPTITALYLSESCKMSPIVL